MKKLFTILAVALSVMLATAQTNQYFWAGGQFIMGNPINQIDSITFGQLEQTDSITLYFPRTVKVIHDTVIQYVTIHDTVCPDMPKWKDGVLPGEFSVSATKKVRFSQGNLQYNAINGTHLCADGSTKQGVWRFAANQYDTIQCEYADISSTYPQWIDHFGWGASGYNNIYPYCLNCNATEQSIESTYYDWGQYVSISNGGNTPSLWRTLSANEWDYVYKTRNNAAQRIAFCTINQMNGIILLPDEWNDTAMFLNFGTYNTISLLEWEQLENLGAVFLPASGTAWPCSYVFTLQHYNDEILYWSTDKTYEGSAYYNSAIISGATTGHDPCDKISVRLVQDVK